MSLRSLIYVFGVILVLLATLAIIHRRNAMVDKSILSTTLKPTERAKVIFNRTKGTVQVVDRTGLPGMASQPIYVGRHDTSVSINVDGTLNLSTRSYGTEIAPFIGAAVTPAEGMRVALGLSVLYYKRTELGVGVLLGNKNKDAGTFLNLSYNVYDNTSLFIGVDNHKQPLVGFSVAF